MTVIKQCVGIDVSQKEIDVTFGVYGLDQSVEFIVSRQFKNTEKSFLKLLKWSEKLSKEGLPLFFVMEATGVYHERLACFLHDSAQKVIVVLPSRASHYAKSLEVKTITDKEASRSLARMGLEKKMDLWVKPNPVYYHLKELTRERERIQKLKTMCKNQIHAEKKSAWLSEDSIRRSKTSIKLFEKQIIEIERQIHDFIAGNAQLAKEISYMTSVKGVGLITAATILGETNGFSAINNKRQLISYSGYDVIRKDSGTSIHGKPRISKKGNRHIRKAMHFPALTSIAHDQPNKDHFLRMVKKHGIKMKAVVAIQRKLLVLMYTLWKKEEFFDESFVSQEVKNKIGQLALP
jgi:transposase